MSLECSFKALRSRLGTVVFFVSVATDRYVGLISESLYSQFLQGGCFYNLDELHKAHRNQDRYLENGHHDTKLHIA
jgi:hypothetical protein